MFDGILWICFGFWISQGFKYARVKHGSEENYP